MTSVVLIGLNGGEGCFSFKRWRMRRHSIIQSNSWKSLSLYLLPLCLDERKHQTSITWQLGGTWPVWENISIQSRPHRRDKLDKTFRWLVAILTTHDNPPTSCFFLRISINRVHPNKNIWREICQIHFVGPMVGESDWYNHTWYGMVCDVYVGFCR